MPEAYLAVIQDMGDGKTLVSRVSGAHVGWPAPPVGVPPGAPTYPGGGPIYTPPTDPGYGQGTPMPPHIGGGPVLNPPGIWPPPGSPDNSLPIPPPAPDNTLPAPPPGAPSNPIVLPPGVTGAVVLVWIPGVGVRWATLGQSVDNTLPGSQPGVTPPIAPTPPDQPPEATLPIPPAPTPS